MRPIALALVALMMVLTLGSVAYADVKMVKKAHTDGFTMMGQTQPAQDETRTIWIGDKRLQVATDSMTFIVLMEESKMFFLQNEANTYFELDLPLDLSEMMPPEMAQAVQAMTMTATVTPTDEEKEIKGFSSRKFNISLSSPMMNVNTVTWATKDIDVDVAAFREMSSQMLALQPNMAKVAEEMKKVDGVELQSETVMEIQMGETSVKSTEELVSVETLDAPAGTYQIPEGFTKKDFDFMEMMRQGR